MPTYTFNLTRTVPETLTVRVTADDFETAKDRAFADPVKYACDPFPEWVRQAPNPGVFADISPISVYPKQTLAEFLKVGETLAGYGHKEYGLRGKNPDCGQLVLSHLEVIDSINHEDLILKATITPFADFTWYVENLTGDDLTENSFVLLWPAIEVAVLLADDQYNSQTGNAITDSLYREIMLHDDVKRFFAAAKAYKNTLKEVYNNV